MIFYTRIVKETGIIKCLDKYYIEVCTSSFPWCTYDRIMECSSLEIAEKYIADMDKMYKLGIDVERILKIYRN